MAVSPAPVIVAAAAGRARRQVTAHFLAHHAISPADAVLFAPERRLVRRQFERMVRQGIVQDAGQGRYWLDLAAYHAAHARVHRWLLIAAFLAAVLIAGALLFGYRG